MSLSNVTVSSYADTGTKAMDLDHNSVYISK